MTAMTQDDLFNILITQITSSRWNSANEQMHESIEKILYASIVDNNYSHKALRSGVAQAISDLVFTAGSTGFLEECQTMAFMGLLTGHLH